MKGVSQTQTSVLFSACSPGKGEARTRENASRQISVTV
jgi:hypothetical protein